MSSTLITPCSSKFNLMYLDQLSQGVLDVSSIIFQRDFLRAFNFQLWNFGFFKITLIGFSDSVVFRDAEKHRDKECLAAIAIQTNWRMLRVKWNFETKVRACRTIERVFRGHIGRL